MTPEDQRNLLGSIGKFVRESIKTAVEPLRERIEELENKQREFRYCGVWGGGPYKQGNFVTHQRSLWHCNLDTENKPADYEPTQLFEMAYRVALKAASDARRAAK
jgi:hypothetical protein